MSEKKPSSPDSPATPPKKPLKLILARPKDTTEEGLREFARQVFDQLKAIGKELAEEKAAEEKAAAEANAKERPDDR